MAIVMSANKESSELGGHIASFASAATLYDVAFNHFFRGQTDEHGGDLVYLPGPLLARHLCPRLPRRPPERRATAQIPPGSRWRRPVFLSAPVADAGLLAVPHRVDGPGPADGDLPGALHALPAAPRHWHRPKAARYGPSSATARPTSRNRWARSPWPGARNWTT